MQDRQKMCASCDGRIPLEADVCPYCASEQQIKSNHQQLQDSLTALYQSPHAAKQSLDKKLEPLKEIMTEKRFNNASASLGIPTIPVESAQETEQDQGRSSFFPILLLSIGGNLLTIGLLQLFFSDNGFLRLEWNSSYWFVYCLAALPLFFFGFKKVNALK